MNAKHTPLSRVENCRGTRYQCYTGQSENDDNYNTTEFTSLDAALKFAKKQKDAWVRVDKWAGERLADGTFDGDYAATVYVAAAKKVRP